MNQSFAQGKVANNNPIMIDQARLLIQKFCKDQACPVGAMKKTAGIIINFLMKIISMPYGTMSSIIWNVLACPLHSHSPLLGDVGSQGVTPGTPIALLDGAHWVRQWMHTKGNFVCSGIHGVRGQQRPPHHWAPTKATIGEWGASKLVRWAWCVCVGVTPKLPLVPNAPWHSAHPLRLRGLAAS